MQGHNELRCLYTNYQSLDNKQGKLEDLVLKGGYSIVAINKTY